MAISFHMVRPSPTTLFSIFLAILHLSVSLSAYLDRQEFILVNECNYTVWPASFTTTENTYLETNEDGLKPGHQFNFTAPITWNGHFWGRTLCTGKGENFSCVTGDCGTGKVSCDGNRGVQPATLAEFHLDKDGTYFYNINVVEGFNIPLAVTPMGVHKENLNCLSAGCPTDMNNMCPTELKVVENDNVVACRGACSTDKLHNFCCLMNNSSTLETCDPSSYSLIFKKACPQASIFPYDNGTYKFNCPAKFFKIIFCPATSMGSLNQNSMSVGDSLTAGNGITRWLSPSGDFAFGFYQLPDELFLLAIWYDKIQNDSIIWYANGDNPVAKGSRLVLNDSYGLVLSNPNGLELWRSSTFTLGRISRGLIKNDGNFQLRDINFVVLWGSFSHFTDTLVPGQALNLNDYLYSRQGEFNFARGKFKFGLKRNGHVELLNLINLCTNTNHTPPNAYYDSGNVDPDNESINFGLKFIFDKSGFLYILKNNSMNFSVITNPNKTISNNDLYYKATINYDGVFTLSYYPRDIKNGQSWVVANTIPENICLDSTRISDQGICGFNSICSLRDDKRPMCRCVKGYSLIDSNNMYGGCKQNVQVICQDRHQGHVTLITLILITLGISMLINLALVGAIFFPHNLKKLRSNATSRSVIHRNLQIFTFKEITDITNNFREEIGRGSCSIVYKGTNNEDTDVAVKKLDKLFQDSDEEFQIEMNVIIETHHRNLVRLHGYCNEGHHRILVYELMSNGSLASFIFAPLKPNWNQRVWISIGIARGLVYLHEECCTQIIHCDIKPQNILLDDDYNAKISDFGLAKLLLINQSHTKTGIRGTKGYVAPDWFMSAPITSKVDAYSFGVLLLEIICCRKNVEGDNVSEEKRILVDWAYDCYKNGKMDILLENEYETFNDFHKLKKFVMISIWCTQEDPLLRPPMKKVLLMLEGIVEVEIPPSPYLYGSSG